METSSKFSHGYALIIGVGGSLPVTMKDAVGVQEILCDAGRGAYKWDHVELLVAEEANRDYILKGLDQLAQYAADDPEATVIVYFSGHGGMSPSYHLVPWGYNPADLPRTAISGSEFTDKLKLIKSKKLLVLLDCCHAGGMTDAKATQFVKSPLPPEIDTMLLPGKMNIRMLANPIAYLPRLLEKLCLVMAQQNVTDFHMLRILQFMLGEWSLIGVKIANIQY